MYFPDYIMGGAMHIQQKLADIRKELRMPGEIGAFERIKCNNRQIFCSFDKHISTTHNFECTAADLSGGLAAFCWVATGHFERFDRVNYG